MRWAPSPNWSPEATGTHRSDGRRTGTICQKLIRQVVHTGRSNSGVIRRSTGGPEGYDPTPWDAGSASTAARARGAAPRDVAGGYFEEAATTRSSCAADAAEIPRTFYIVTTLLGRVFTRPLPSGCTVQRRIVGRAVTQHREQHPEVLIGDLPTAPPVCVIFFSHLDVSASIVSVLTLE